TGHTSNRCCWRAPASPAGRGMARPTAAGPIPPLSRGRRLTSPPRSCTRSAPRPTLRGPTASAGPRAPVLAGPSLDSCEATSCNSWALPSPLPRCRLFVLGRRHDAQPVADPLQALLQCGQRQVLAPGQHMAEHVLGDAGRLAEGPARGKLLVNDLLQLVP